MKLKKQQLKNKKKTSRRKLVLYLLIPGFFFMLWVTLSILYSTSKANPTILIHEHNRSNITLGKSSELLKGERIKGEFIAKEDNLGIVAVRFNTFLRINDDSVLFRLKEKGENKWFYEYKYKVDQFQPNDYFTFGFPIIINSQGKTYQFEVESVIGKPKNAVALSLIEPIFVTKYQYSRAEIISNREYLTTFVMRKLINTFSNLDFLLSFFVYSLPLVLYLVWLFFFEKYLYNKYYLALVPIALMMIISILNPPSNDAIVFGLTGFWIAVSLAFKLKTEITFYFSLSFLILVPLLLYSSFFDVSKNIAMWSLILLFSGIIFQLIEFLNGRENQLGFEVFSIKSRNKKRK